MAEQRPVIAGMTSGGDVKPILVDSDGKILTSAELQVSDIEIGAVEIKDADSENRAAVITQGADNLSDTTNQLVTAGLNYAFAGEDWKRVRCNNSGALHISIREDVVGLASESTLSSLNGKVTKCDTDNTKVVEKVASSFSHNQTTVGSSSAVQLTTTSTPCKFGIIVKADDSNTGNIYVGGSGVTTSSGFKLQAGQGISFEIDDASKVYVIADADNQKVHWIAI